MRKPVKNRIWLFAVLLCMLVCGCKGIPGAEVPPSPDVTATPAPTPAPLNEPLALDVPSVLSDGDAATWIGGYVVLHNEERKIGSVYLEWDKIPEQWTLVADGKEIVVEKNGFLHQYVVLDEPAEMVSFHADTPLCDVFAFEQGADLPDWVQIWQPTLEHADLLLLPTHADDEHVFFGGMMPYYAGERGYKVQVVYLTNHWHQLYRPHELLDGLWTAGIRNYPVIGPFQDRWAGSLEEAEAQVSRYDAAVFLTEQLRRFKPSVIIGHDLKGEYGHGQHVLNAVALTDAVLAATDANIFSESAEKYGTWNTPKMYLHLYPQNEIVMDWSVPLSAFGGKTAMDVAKEAFALHETQQGFFYVYGEGDDWDSRRFGLYRSTVGEDVVGGDVFENITSFY